MKSILYFFLLLPYFVFAQQLPEGSHFANTNFAFNPALTATSDYLEAHALYRREWTGFDQVPRNISAGLQYPIIGSNMSLGLLLQQDEVGVFRQTDVRLSYAYHVPIASSQRLSFGLSVNLSQSRYAANEVIATDESDVFFIEGEGSKFQTNAGFGISYATLGVNEYQKSHFFLAAGINQLIPSDLIFDDLSKTANFRRVMHVFGTLGYRFQLDFAYVEPSLQINYVAENVTKFRFHLNYEMEDAFWAGVSLDSNVRFGGQAGVILREQTDGQFRIGAQMSYGGSTLTKVQGLGYSVIVGYSFGL